MKRLNQKKLSLILLALMTLVIFTGCQENKSKLGKVKSIQVEYYGGEMTLCVAAEEINKDLTKIKNSLNEKGIGVRSKNQNGKTIFILSNWYDQPELLKQLGISKYTSENFEYYTLGDKDKTEKLESIYQALTGDILKFYGAVIPEGKIRYVALPSQRNGGIPYAWGRFNMVVDPWDCSSSHELIHLLAPIRSRAFSEGVAQGLQREGNEIMKDQNVSLNTKKLIQKGGFTNLETIIRNGPRGKMRYYWEMGSFVYYNIYKTGKAEQFGKFLKSLENGTLPEVKRKYKEMMGKDFDTAVKEWKQWVKGINEDSDVYVKWGLVN